MYKRQELCDAWAEELAPLPVGLALECPPEPDAEHCERPITMHYIEPVSYTHLDSGLGGLTAVRRLHALMPQENIIYFGDTGRVPCLLYTSLVACDVYRPAAIEQLKVVGKQLNIPVFDEGQGDPVEIAKHGIDFARKMCIRDRLLCAVYQGLF